jgi:hypothetical protein
MATKLVDSKPGEDALRSPNAARGRISSEDLDVGKPVFQQYMGGHKTGCSSTNNAYGLGKDVGHGVCG